MRPLIKERCWVIYKELLKQQEKEHKREELKKELKKYYGGSVFVEAAKKIGVKKQRVHQIFRKHFNDFLKEEGLEMPKTKKVRKYIDI